jgi:hypothetical protein
MPSSESHESDPAIRMSGIDLPRTEVATSAESPIERSEKNLITQSADNPASTAAPKVRRMTLDLATGGDLEIRSESGRQHYEDFLEQLLAGALSRKGTFEQRGITVVTTAGTLVTIVFAIVSFVLAHVTRGVNPHSVVRSWIDVAAILFVLASVLGLLVNLPVRYGEPDPLDLGDLVLPGDGTQPDVPTDQSVAQELDRARRLIENRELLTYSRLDGILEELEQLLADTGRLPFAQFITGILSYLKDIDGPDSAPRAPATREPRYVRWLNGVSSYVVDRAATVEPSLGRYMRSLDQVVATLDSYMDWLERMDMLPRADSMSEAAGLPFLTATADEAALQIAQTRVKLLLQARRRNSRKAELLFSAVLSEVAAIASLAWGIHGLLGL